MKMDLTREEIAMVCESLSCKIEKIEKQFGKTKIQEKIKQEQIKKYKELYSFFDKLFEKKYFLGVK